MCRTRIALVAALFLAGQPLASGQEMPTIYETYQPDPQYVAGYVVGLDDNWISNFGAGPGWNSDVHRKLTDARKLTRQVGSGAHGFSFDLLPDRRVGTGAHGFPSTRPHVPRPKGRSVSLGACNTDGTRAGCLTQWHLEDRLSGRISKEEYFEGLEAQGKGAILGAGGGVMFLASAEAAVAMGAYYGYNSLMTGLLGTGFVAGDMMFMASSPLAQETLLGTPMMGVAAGIVALPDTGARVVSPVVMFMSSDSAYREVVVVQLEGGQTQAFERAIPSGAGRPGPWLPFDGIHENGWIDRTNHEYRGGQRLGSYSAVSSALNRTIMPTGLVVAPHEVNYVLDAYDALKPMRENPLQFTPEENARRRGQPMLELVGDDWQGTKRRHVIDMMLTPKKLRQNLPRLR